MTPSVALTVARVLERPAELIVGVKVAAAFGAPAGSVTLTGAGIAKPIAASLVAGAAQIVVPGSTLTLGSQKLTVSYAGSTDYAAASASATVEVEKEIPAVKVTTASKTVPRSSALQVTVDVTSQSA